MAAAAAPPIDDLQRSGAGCPRSRLVERLAPVPFLKLDRLAKVRLQRFADQLLLGADNAFMAVDAEIDPMMRRATLRYRFRLDDLPSWTQARGIKALYPWLEKRLTEEDEALVDLVYRDGGWRIDRAAPPLALDLQQLGY